MAPPDHERFHQTGHEMTGFDRDDGAMTNATLTYDDAVADPDMRPADRRTSAIITDGLVRTFGGVPAVDGLDLEVRHGEIYGFLGPNGAGKSTTVRVLCTLLAP